VEVENFRQLMLRLVTHGSSNKVPCCLSVETPSPTPPKIFPTDSDFEIIKRCVVTNVERKGKLLRVVLLEQSSNSTTSSNQQQSDKKLNLYFHMGMTGRISCPDNIPSLESLTTSDSFPPPHTHLILKVNKRSSSNNGMDQNDNDDLTSCVAFSDPRRFGTVSLGEPLSLQWEELAQDALMHNSQEFIQNISGQKKGIKSLLLDQRAVVSGVGNWIADEILYQCEIHPDQRFLTVDEATALSICLNKVLQTGIECLSLHQDYPLNWLFHHRWNKGKQGTQKDFNGKTIAYVQSGGRTSAIVPTLQKMKSSRKGSKKEDKVIEAAEVRSTKKFTNASQQRKQQSKQKLRNEDDQNNHVRRSKRIANCENK